MSTHIKVKFKDGTEGNIHSESLEYYQKQGVLKEEKKTRKTKELKEEKKTK